MLILFLEYVAVSMKEKRAFIGYLFSHQALSHFILLSFYIHDTLSIVQTMKLGFSGLSEVTEQRVD